MQPPSKLRYAKLLGNDGLSCVHPNAVYDPLLSYWSHLCRIQMWWDQATSSMPHRSHLLPLCRCSLQQ